MPVAMMMNEVQNYPVDERVAFADAVLQTLNPVDSAIQEKWHRENDGQGNAGCRPQSLFMP